MVYLVKLLNASVLFVMTGPLGAQAFLHRAAAR